MGGGGGGRGTHYQILQEPYFVPLPTKVDIMFLPCFFFQTFMVLRHYFIWGPIDLVDNTTKSLFIYLFFFYRSNNPRNFLGCCFVLSESIETKNYVQVLSYKHHTMHMIVLLSEPFLLSLWFKFTEKNFFSFGHKLAKF